MCMKQDVVTLGTLLDLVETENKNSNVIKNTDQISIYLWFKLFARLIII